MSDSKTLVERLEKRLHWATERLLFCADDADMIRQAAARIEVLEAEVNRVCVWTKQARDEYLTGCGKEWAARISVGLFTYCPDCGGKLETD